jgi:hypothetical protein
VRGQPGLEAADGALAQHGREQAEVRLRMASLRRVGRHGSAATLLLARSGHQ